MHVIFREIVLSLVVLELSRRSERNSEMVVYNGKHNGHLRKSVHYTAIGFGPLYNRAVSYLTAL